MSAGLAPPRAKGLPLLGNTLRLLQDPLAFTIASARDYGDVVDLNINLAPIYLVNHPDLIERVLVGDHRSYVRDRSTKSLSIVLGDGLLTSDGELWKRQRRLAQPGFHKERVASYGEVMVRYTERMLATWSSGEVRNVHDDMMQLTREIVAKTLFDADVRGEAKEAGKALETIIKRFADVPPGVPFIDKIPTPGRRRFQEASRKLDEIIYGIIAERRASGRDAGDLLSMLMNASDEGGGSMADRQIRDEAMTLFLAGHETTALTLTWTWLLLSQNPACAEKLRLELAEVLGGRLPTVSDLPRMRYADQVITESMRLFPPAWAIGREAANDTTLGDYRVPRGAQVWISQYVVHRDVRWFEDPETFSPERWDGDYAKRLPKYAYFPFGGGPRLCIGAAFATMEAVLLLATIAQRFRIDVVPGQPIDPVAAVTLRPKHGLRAAIAHV